MKAYLVVLIDISWDDFNPLGISNMGNRIIVRKPPLQKCEKEVQLLLTFIKNTLKGKCVITPFSGIYCRSAFHEEPFISLWNQAVEQGGEIAIHTHEEIVEKGVIKDRIHYSNVIIQLLERLKNAGIEPCGYRGGHATYFNFLTKFLEELNLLIDLTSIPGFNKKSWSAVWSNTSLSAYYLCPFNHLVNCIHAQSNVLEIPLGFKGNKNDFRNYLWIEQADLNDLKSVWDSIVFRAERVGKPQIIYSLFHSHSMSKNKIVRRFSEFLEYASNHGGKIVTSKEARKIFNILNN